MPLSNDQTRAGENGEMRRHGVLRDSHEAVIKRLAVAALLVPEVMFPAASRSAPIADVSLPAIASSTALFGAPRQPW